MTKQHCQQCDDYISRDLPPGQRISFEEHLNDCDECRRSINEWNSLRATLKIEVEQRDRPDVSLLARIKSVTTRPRPAEATRNPALTMFAAVCVLVAPALLFLAMNQFNGHREGLTTAIVQQDEVTASPPEVTLTFSDDVIDVPIDIGDPNVTVVWIYPVHKKPHQTN